MGNEETGLRETILDQGQMSLLSNSATSYTFTNLSL